jgi:hypothetical protein
MQRKKARRFNTFAPAQSDPLKGEEKRGQRESLADDLHGDRDERGVGADHEKGGGGQETSEEGWAGAKGVLGLGHIHLHQSDELYIAEPLAMINE